MRIGIKLDIDFDASESYQALTGGHDAPAFLRQLGVQAAETPVGPTTRAEAVLEYARRCAAAGLRVSLHPYTEATPFNPAWFEPSGGNPPRELHEQFLRLAGEIAAQQDAPTIVNIHPAAAPRSGSERAALLEQSVRFFAWARRWTETHAPQVQPVAELQIRAGDDEDMQRVGDDYGELLEIARRTGVGACWDFGHAVMNHLVHGLPADPPAELLPHVRHVHCHDVDRCDHQPLLHDNVPWRRFLRQLGEVGFDGTVLLEVPARNFLAAGGLGALERSLNVLAELVA